MDNNYSSGFESGARGEQFSGGGAQEYAGWEAGRATYLKRMPQTHIDGPGFTAMVMAPLICIVYPIAGVLAIGTAWLAMEGMIRVSAGVGPRIFVPLLAGLVVFFAGFAVERRLAKLKPYRILRDCWRLALGSIIPYQVLTSEGSEAPEGGVVVFSLILIPVLLWLLKKVDRVVGAGGIA